MFFLFFFLDILTFVLRMASSTASGSDTFNLCANCFVYNWVQADPTVLQKCKQCKVVQYCSKECQVEHWKSCHRTQCKDLKAAKESWREGDIPVSIFSHHPFPVNGMPEDTTEALIIVAGKVLSKMQRTAHPAFSTNAALLAQICENMESNLGEIYSSRKIYPPAVYTVIQSVSPKDLSDLLLRVSMIFVNKTEDQFGLWCTLHLILNLLVNHLVLLSMVGMMKEPQVSVPEQLWQGMEKEVGVFPDVVQQIIEVFSANDPHIPPYKKILEIVCGGSLSRACRFCSKQIVVGQVGGEGVPSVRVYPYFPQIFTCGEKSCQEQSDSKFMLLTKWKVGVIAALSKLAPNTCDFCFKFSEKVHR